MRFQVSVVSGKPLNLFKFVPFKILYRIILYETMVTDLNYWFFQWFAQWKRKDFLLLLESQSVPSHSGADSVSSYFKILFISCVCAMNVQRLFNITDIRNKSRVIWDGFRSSSFKILFISCFCAMNVQRLSQERLRNHEYSERERLWSRFKPFGKT